jgi:DNA-binding MarR family transcriptional regulator
MRGMANVRDSLVFHLGLVGTVATDRYAARLEKIELKPKHVGLMLVLEAGLASSQLEIAKLMGIAPSLVVMFADHLEELGAIKRVRDPADRRRQLLSLTDKGKVLLYECGGIARSLDQEIARDLSKEERAAATKLLARIGSGLGLPLVGKE